jgi:type 1 fimbriae regulatory protein FimB/type 1 fimbriae regulatory protein FimE
MPRPSKKNQRTAPNGRPLPPIKKKKSALDNRLHLTEEEVKQLAGAAQKLGRQGHRDSTMILFAFRHGLRCGELIATKWEQLHLASFNFAARRLKRGKPANHDLLKSEVKALRKLPGAREGVGLVFQKEGGGPMGHNAFYKIVQRAGKEAGLEAKLGFPIHPHMLRHACGFYLANKGIDTRAIQEYLGHRNINHTVKYTELAPGRFKGFFED